MRTRHSDGSSCSSCTNRAIGIWLTILVFMSVALIGSASNPENEENSAYFFACSGGDFSLVKSLIEKEPSLVHEKTNDGEHCLHLSALSGNAEIVAFLLEHKADPDVRSNWENGLRMHPLSWSTFYGRHEIIELLLKHGADVNADFDSGKKDDKGELEKVTVLDVIEQILMGMDTEDAEEKERFTETRNVLVKNGAMRYASLEPEL